jgi:hypothetical protein
MQILYLLKSAIREWWLVGLPRLKMQSNKYVLRSETEVYDYGPYYTGPEDGDTTTFGGRKQYYFPLSVVAASSGTFEYPFVCFEVRINPSHHQM